MSCLDISIAVRAKVTVGHSETLPRGVFLPSMVQPGPSMPAIDLTENDIASTDDASEASDLDAGPPTERVDQFSPLTRVGLVAGLSVTVLALATQPAAAQVGSAFCQSDMATTIKNLFTLIQFGGPLVGGVIALGAIVATPTVRRADMKREIKEIRNQAIIWGIIVAPLGTAIVAFLLNNVVAGGSSCGF